ncbi:hypothetical protein [Amycolatopsis aidingensis]|uniref:hypothetical protein n=1 Tax=Amycolatopsis aidingensis TaxID=2842453 RepID=UPI001C0C357F|nr:hypothetical protein [Amycolatopsis aidingensis]
MADIGVTQGELRKAGNALMDAADGGKTGSGDTGGSSDLSGTNSAVSTGGSLDGFAIRGALNTCETQWEDATDSMLAKISLTGDKLVLAADSYDEIEADNTEPFRFLEG